jgi:hypothetical protein
MVGRAGERSLPPVCQSGARLIRSSCRKRTRDGRSSPPTAT